MRKRRELLGVIKDYKKAIEDGDEKNASDKLPGVYKKLDKAVKVRLIKKNRANRLKSRLTKKLHNRSPQSSVGGKTS